MKVNGNVTTLEFVSHAPPDSPLPPAVFLVQFDGEWDTWFSRLVRPTEQEVQECLGELELYYRRDWAGTGRDLRVFYSGQMQAAAIDCK